MMEDIILFITENCLLATSHVKVAKCDSILPPVYTKTLLATLNSMTKRIFSHVTRYYYFGRKLS